MKLGCENVQKAQLIARFVYLVLRGQAHHVALPLGSVDWNAQAIVKPCLIAFVKQQLLLRRQMFIPKHIGPQKRHGSARRQEQHRINFAVALLEVMLEPVLGELSARRRP